MSYKSISLKTVFTIDKIVTIHYFEYMSNFFFPGEIHNFWEFLYVDKGDIEITADDKKVTLAKGEIIFHKPNEFHAVKANGYTAPNLVVIAFECNSPAINFFNNKILTVSELEWNLIAQIIIEAKHTYASRLDDPYLKQLHRLKHPMFASEQLIKLYLEQLLIQLYRKYTARQNYNSPLPKSIIRKKSDQEIYNHILSYLETNIYTHLTIEQITKDNLISRSQLQKLFRDKNNCGVIEYFSKMKIEVAKQLIRHNHLNFTQISTMLGYTSIHYFSRQFKKITNMSPSEYALSIKALSDEQI